MTRGGKSAARRIAACGMMTALAMILAYLEALLPFSFGIPGVKLGLPNLVTVFLLYAGGVFPAAAVAVLRIVLTGFLFGNVFSILYSLSGFVFSIVIMALLRKTDRLELYAVSAAGGAAHNLGQLTAAVLLTNIYTAAYLPVLLLAGTLSGLVIGLVGGLISARLTGLWKKL